MSSLKQTIDRLPDDKRKLLGVGLIAPSVAHAIYLVVEKNIIVHALLFAALLGMAYVGIELLKGKAIDTIVDDIQRKTKR